MNCIGLAVSVELYEPAMKTVARFIAYIFSFCIGAVMGAIFLFFLVGFVYSASHPNPVMDSYECARGTVIGLGALMGGAICGAGLGCQAMSRVLYSADCVVGELDLTEMESLDSFTRKLRNATHQICAGGVVIGFSAFSSAQIFMLTFLFGLISSLVGFGRFIGAHFVRPGHESRTYHLRQAGEPLVEELSFPYKSIVD